MLKHPTKQRKLHLQSLPVELQHQIYTLALVEIPRWDKLHEPRCDYKPSRIGPPEPPPFLQASIHVSKRELQPWKVQTKANCPCAKRKGIHLLQTNRQIHTIAAPIFWSSNTFCFLDAWEFVAAVGHILRPTCRTMLRFISIMNIQKDSPSRQVCLDILPTQTQDSMLSQFWAAVAKCPNLRKLQVPIWYMDRLKHTPDQLLRLPAKLPKLREIGLTMFMTYCVRRSHTLYDTWDACCSYDHLVTHVSCVRSLAVQDEAWNETAMAAFLRDTRLNFCVHVDTITKTQFLGADVNTLESWRESMQLAPAICEGSRRRRVTLPSGVSTTLTFYNVPVSRKSRAKRTRYIMQRDRLQKSVNGQTHHQNTVNEKLRTARRQKYKIIYERDAELRNASRADRFAHREQRRLELQLAEEETEHQIQRSATLLGPKETKQARRDRRRARRRS